MKKSLGLIVCLTVLLGVTSAIAQDLPVNHAAAGIKVVVSDTWIFNAGKANLSYWEPTTDIFGDGTIVIGANTFPENEDGMNMKVAFVNPTTGKVEEFWGFYTDAGEPWKGPFNEKRKDGNPARVAVDRTPGGVRYIVGMESTPYLYEQFNTGDRWYKKYNYDHVVGTVQIFEKTASGPKPITNAFDPIYQPGDLPGEQMGQQMRYGGELQFLSNGNILTVVEDRTKNIVKEGNGVIASIFDGKTGALIKGPFNAAGDGAPHSTWSNAVAFKGGFCVRTEKIFTVYDNDGNMKYFFEQSLFSTVKEEGRGDGVRIGSNPGTNYVFFAGKDSSGEMVVSRFDAVATTNGENLQGVKEDYVNEKEFALNTFDRADIGVDENGNFCVTYEDTSVTGAEQIVARVFNSELEPVTPTFMAFAKADGMSGDVKGVSSKESNVTMSNEYIVIGADGVIWDETKNALSEAEQTFFIVLENPLKKATDVKEWSLF